MPVELVTALELDAAIVALLTSLGLLDALLKTLLAADLAVRSTRQVVILSVADLAYLQANKGGVG